jgi:3-hydroxybutyryl-CoA dehydrogenase
MGTELQDVAVIGSGYMGGGIAQVLALAGCSVALGDVDEATATRAHARITAQTEAFEHSGLFPSGSAERIRHGVTPRASIEEAVAEAQYVTEAVPETRAIKTGVLSRISAAAPASAVIGSNTSAIPIAELAQSVSVPERFLGVHWMNPAPFIPGVELIATEDTSAEVLASVDRLIRRAGKKPARVSDSPGFVANRLQFALFKEAVLMVEEGLATAEQIDLVVSNAFGFRLALFGPFAIADMAGLDVYGASYDSLAAEYGERLAAPQALTDLVENGHLGLKSGGGFLDIPASNQVELLEYRDMAYARLSQLRAELGAAPGLES